MNETPAASVGRSAGVRGRLVMGTGEVSDRMLACVETRSIGAAEENAAQIIGFADSQAGAGEASLKARGRA